MDPPVVGAVLGPLVEAEMVLAGAPDSTVDALRGTLEDLLGATHDRDVIEAAARVAQATAEADREVP